MDDPINQVRGSHPSKNREGWGTHFIYPDKTPSAKAGHPAFVDKGTQGTDAAMTNLHAMAGTLPDGTIQTVDEAYQGTQDAITEALSENNQYTDPFNVHTIEDSYSSSHNYNPDTSTLTGLNPLHAIPDLMYHSAARDAVASYLRDRKNGRKCDPKKYLNPPNLPVPSPYAAEPVDW